MSQYAHSVSANLNGSVSLYLQLHDDVSVSMFQSHKGFGNWTNIDFANLDIAEAMANDMLTAIKRRREMTETQLDTEYRRNEDAYADLMAEQSIENMEPAHVGHTDAF